MVHEKRRNLDGGFDDAYLNGDEASDLDDLIVSAERMNRAFTNEDHYNVKIF